MTPKNISLRDWYAGLAMQGLSSKGYAEDSIARVAYRIADAMLAEREKQK